MRRSASLPTLRTGLVAVAALTVGTGLLVAPAAHAESDPIKITQSYSDAILPLNGLACSDNVDVSANSFLRRFTLADYDATEGFNVSSVSVGIEEVINDPTGAVSIYSIDSADDLVFANLDPVDTEPVSYTADQSGTLLTIPLAGAIAAGKDLVIEMTTDQSTDGSLFYPGTNDQGESAPGYLASSDCGLNEPATFGEIGFDGVDLVMFATGKSGECVTAEDAAAAAPAAVDAAQADLDAATAAEATAAQAVTSAQKSATAAKKAVTKASKAVKTAKKNYTKAVKKFGKNSKQAKAAQSKLKKAKANLAKATKKAKAAKAKLAQAKSALVEAQAATTAASDALDAAQAALDAAVATEDAECAQPELPTAPARAPSTGLKALRPANGFGFHTAGR